MFAEKGVQMWRTAYADNSPEYKAWSGTVCWRRIRPGVLLTGVETIRRSETNEAESLEPSAERSARTSGVSGPDVCAGATVPATIAEVASASHKPQTFIS